jgi:transposase
MNLLHEKCAGLDVHKDTVVACARIQQRSKVDEEIQTFGTTMRELLRLSDWLQERGCTHVAMESTGVYWKPVWHILEGSFELVLGNAMEIRNVPGRKTDVKDAAWIADLLAHGLIRASFVPPSPVREMRDLTRTRKQLVREITQHTQRIQKVLEDANLKITGLITNILGSSGRAILDAIISGQSDPTALAALAKGRLRAKHARLVEALHGRITSHHRFLLRLHLGQIDALNHAILQIEQQLGEVLRPFRAAVDILTTLPGISDVVAHVILAEIGIDMSRFPTDAHLRSWAGMSPRSDASAGKRRSNRVRKGAPWLKTVLVQAAWAAARSKKTYFHAQFLRLKARRGPKKAILAVAASILTAAYHMLHRGVTYQELGPDYFERRNRAKIVRKLLRRLESLGCRVTVQPAA